jgi:hypothetical protein
VPGFPPVRKISVEFDAEVQERTEVHKRKNARKERNPYKNSSSKNPVTLRRVSSRIPPHTVGFTFVSGG